MLQEEFRLPLSRESLLSQVKPHPISLLEDDFLSSLITILLLFLNSPLNGSLTCECKSWMYLALVSPSWQVHAS